MFLNFVNNDTYYICTKTISLQSISVYTTNTYTLYILLFDQHWTWPWVTATIRCFAPIDCHFWAQSFVPWKMTHFKLFSWETEAAVLGVVLLYISVSLSSQESSSQVVDHCRQSECGNKRIGTCRETEPWMQWISSSGPYPFHPCSVVHNHG